VRDRDHARSVDGGLTARSAVASALAACALAALAGCGGDADDPPRGGGGSSEPPAFGAEGGSAPGDDARRGETASPDGKAASPGGEPELPRVPCPPDLVGCKEAAGRIIYVERVDPDGDGDAHFVLLSREGITGPGITVVDVRADLRPDPLPRRGDLLGAAGPVYTGSYGQRQIEAVAVRAVR
jgi:hypothetical protein